MKKDIKSSYTVVKVGGSLALNPLGLKALCNELSEISENHRLLIVPGGGEFSDVVRTIDSRFKLPCKTTHRMAILGMDQYGLLLSELIANSVLVRTVKEAEKALFSNRLPIFLPSTLLFNDEKLEPSWDLTSDSITAYLAGLIDTKRLLLITDVDGIFSEDPKKSAGAKLINELTVQELLIMNKRTSIDRLLSRFLIGLKIDCYIVNGFFPERIEAIISGKNTICTKIKAQL